MQSAQASNVSNPEVPLIMNMETSPSTAREAPSTATNQSLAPIGPKDEESKNDTENQLDKTDNNTTHVSRSANLQRQLGILNLLRSHSSRLRILPSHLFLQKSTLNSFDGNLSLGLPSVGPNETTDTDAFASFLTSDLAFDPQIRIRAQEAFRVVSTTKVSLLGDDSQESLKVANESDRQERLIIPHIREQQ